MSAIDKGMYRNLKNWWNGKGAREQKITYVNANDRELTKATIRKMVFDALQEDEFGEIYAKLYSAKNFYRNMRKYFTHISELYRNFHSEDTPLMDIVENITPTCGWILLIVEDIEELSEEPDKLQEMMDLIIAFALDNAKIILVGKGDYKDVFSKCKETLNEIRVHTKTKKGEGVLKIGAYKQKDNPKTEDISANNIENRRDELDFYWNVFLEQLEGGYLDYSEFKLLFKETMGYLIPRVSKEKVYRKDLWLIEKIGDVGNKKGKNIDGCRPWEYDASQKCASALHRAIVNTYNYNDDISKGEIALDVTIEDPKIEHGGIVISGYMSTTLRVNLDNVAEKIDFLAQDIFEVTYEGNSSRKWTLLSDGSGVKKDGNMTDDGANEIDDKVNSLVEGILEIADKTINKETGTKVRRYKKKMDESGIQMSEDGETDLDHISEKTYTVSLDKIKGHEKIDSKQVMDANDCSLMRYVVKVDESSYTINDDGLPEMSRHAQEKYEEFLRNIRQEMENSGIDIADEGYGTGENELEWHITGYAMDEETNMIKGVLGFETCVRTVEQEDTED